MAYNTGNPLGSSSPKDLSDNAHNLDVAMNGPALSFTDRFGVSRYSIVRLHTMIATAVSEVDPTVSAAKIAVNNTRDSGINSINSTVTQANTDVNTARDTGVLSIGQSVQSVDDAEAVALLQMIQTAAQLGADLNNKHYSTNAQMRADPQTRDAVIAVVDGDPNAALNGWHYWSKTANDWFRFADQPAMSSAMETLRKSVSQQLRPRGQITKDSPLALSMAGKSVQVAAQQSMPRGPSLREGPYTIFGDTPVPPSITRLRPRSQGFSAEVVVISGRSVLGSFGASTTPVVTVDLSDAKLIQEQNQAPVGTRQAAIVGGQVWGYDPLSASALTSTGTWIAANSSAFDIVRAIKSGSPPQPHSILRDGRILRDGNVLLHHLATGQSLALGSRGVVIDPTGNVVIAGKTGRLVSPFTPIGYANSLFTLPGGPRPTSWVGATALEPVREYASDPLGETPATSYMLALQKWYERTSSIRPRLMYSISAVGGMAYAGLKKGTAPYNDALAHVTAAKNIAAANGWDYQVSSISWVHGESQINTTQAEYVAMIVELITDYRTDIGSITNQPVLPKLYMSQMLTGENGTVPAIPLAELQAHNENDNVILVCPKYAYQPYFDTYHMTAEGYVKTGELEARAVRLTQVSGKWQPLKPVAATISGSTITLRLNNLPNGNAATSGPIGKLAIDRVTVSDPGSAGFQISAGTITSVALGEDGASVVITTAAPVAAGTTLTYALQNLNSSQTGNGRRGCIRDADMRDVSRYDGKFLYNWLCAFSLELQ